ncbi:POTRA domain-containing protein [Larkinella soli]|uniref:POTRA domain-containing protein n=1 Tax=Larkinella soli TaxID=1770527 RepID=UPI000FFC4ED6|nr:POTRA domain-containing protein [Larkinella soli]
MLLTFLFWTLSLADTTGRPAPPVDSLNTPVVVRSVQIRGNHRTRERIILREMDVRVGDTIRREDLTAKLAWDQRKITNTNLFVTVDVVAHDVGSQLVDVEVSLKERWYVFVIPVFELADRNFNEWWYERGRSFRRTIYGARLSYKNVTGNADKLSAIFEFGFARRTQVVYSLPYIDRAQKTGISVGVSYQTNKEVAYRSSLDKLVYLRTEDLLRDRFFTNVVLTRRNRFFNFHRLELRYARNSIADTVAKLNPDYFLDGQTRQRYLQLSYAFIHDRRDAVAYPLQGHWLTLTANQYGLLPSDHLRLFEATGNYTRYWSLGGRFYASSSLRGKLSWPDRQPYLNFRGLGYLQDFVRGYELYVIDGQRYGLVKNTLKYQLLNVRKQFDWVPVRQFNTVPFAMYVAVFGDAGYVGSTLAREYDSRLANSFLFGGGLALDFVTFYNLVGRISYSVNRQGKTGLFFNLTYDL